MHQIFKLSLKLKSGLLSELQSDTIMGHFCWRLKEKSGVDKLKEFINLYHSGTPLFSVSNGLMEIFSETIIKEEPYKKLLLFPKPLLSSPFEIKSSSKKERIENFLKYKDLKTRKLISLEQLNLFINGKIEEYEKSCESDENKISFPGLKEDLRVSVQIDRNSFASEEGKLFSYHPKYADDKTLFSILIKVYDEEKFAEFGCEELLKTVFETGFGKKKSSGYGHFEVASYDEFTGIQEPDNPDGFITLGNYLKAESDNVTDGFYDYNVKYGRMGEDYSSGSSPFKIPMLLLTQGSCFFTNNPKSYYGRVTEFNEISKTADIYQFGVPFTINFRK